MRKNIAIVGCADTKSEEMLFLKSELEKYGLGTLLIDTSLRYRPETAELCDICTKDLLRHGGYPADVLAAAKKSEAVSIVTECLKAAISALYSQGRISGGISAGGMQNSVISSGGLQMLPFGVPKILISSMANSYMSCEMFTGRSDLVIMPSVADASGVNSITSAVYQNAAAALAGMVNREPVKSESSREIAITSVGVTNDGVLIIADRLKRLGYTPVFFHGTTGGARAMEELLLQGRFEAAFDLDVHDILVEAIGYYVINQSSTNRLERLKNISVPMVFSFSGLDVIDMPRSYFETADIPEKDRRKVYRHNAELYHVKVTHEEAVAGAERFAQRLNALSGPVAVVAPLRGFRDNVQAGEALYDPEIDRTIIETVKNRIKPSVLWREVDCSANDEAYAETVIQIWKQLKRR